MEASVSRAPRKRPIRRYATIDIGTEIVALLVAELDGDGRYQPIVQRRAVTRIGLGVDETKFIDADRLDATLSVIVGFVKEARNLGALAIAAVATSAARDAANAEILLQGVKERAGIDVEIVSGELEAQLTYQAAQHDFASLVYRPLSVIDIGGGSTQVTLAGHDGLRFSTSLPIGAVRLTERMIKTDPIEDFEFKALAGHVEASTTHIPPMTDGGCVVGMSGIVTSMFAIVRGVAPDDFEKIQGQVLTRSEVDHAIQRLRILPQKERSRVRGLPEEHADIILVGGLILKSLLAQLGANECVVSDRGLRWGYMHHRFD